MAGPTIAFQTGNHAGRPAASAGCVLYSCTTHSKLYRSDGTTWTDYFESASVSEILDLPTAETDGSLVLAPDGAGGVEFRAETGSGGSLFAPDVEHYVVTPFSSTASKAVTIPATAAGKRIVVFISSYGQDVTGISCTNVTFTEVLSAIQTGAAYLSVYVGVVAGGSSGTTITITTATATNIFPTTIIIGDAVTPNIVDTATMNSASSTTDSGKLIGPIDCAVGDLILFGWATNNAAAITAFEASSPIFVLPPDSLTGMRCAIGIAGADSVSAYFIGGPNANYAAGIAAVN